MKMHVLSGGRIRMRKSVYVPDAGTQDLIDLPVMCVLIRHPQGNVLFDTGCHPDVASEPDARWGGMAKFMTLVSGPRENVIDELAGVGLAPEDVDVVVNSHFHTDHCGCNEFFRKATVVCHAKELEAASAPDAVKKGYLAIDWKHPMPIDAFEGERDLFGDGRIVLLPIPGHTPGTVSALVGLERSGTFLLAADAVPLREILARDYSARNNWNAEQAVRSLAEVRRIQASGATVLFGHDLAQWESLRRGAHAYD